MNDHPWTEEQRARLRECIAAGDTIAYWNSDAHGRPANGGTHDGWVAHPGLIQQVDPNAFASCGPGALHGTDEPHRWRGVRVWVVAMRGRVERQYDKIAATVREILGEVLPEHAWSPSVGVRLGRKDLAGADLRRAHLDGANLGGADLRRADLAGADLAGADLRRADLRRACLTGADLGGADLAGAHLDGADLGGWGRGPDGFARRRMQR